EQILGMPAAEIHRRIQSRRATGHIFTPIELKTDISSDTAFILEERHWELPGISVLIEPRRQYTDGNALSHILGYVGRISDEEYAELKTQGYELNDDTGKMGVEYTYERVLRGLPGREQAEVDVTGRRRRTLDQEPAKAGDNLVLSIDLNLQQEMLKALQAGMGKSRFAAAAVMDVRNGELLGLASLPTFDNNLFSGGIQQGALDHLLNDERRPLLNYATGGTYPPGSIFKIITASGALQENIARRDTVIVSRSSISLASQYDPRVLYHFYDWASLGPLNFPRAIAMSSDVYFYYLAGGYENFKGLGPTKLAAYSRLFGLGEKTGIDLPGEAAGSVPDPKWKRDTLGEEWLTGDSYNFGIGQGYLLSTPLQMVRAAAALANGGEVLQPRVVRGTTDASGRPVKSFEKVVQRRLDVAPAHLSLIREGMRLAVTEGTARTGAAPNVNVAGKTGTAEFGTPIGRVSDTHGWFLGIAPHENPEIAVVVFFEHGNGALTAAPAASKIIEYYFRQRQGANR
ncbi:MAG: penicillin-binding protein 2, partial [Chloroflexota bacterium]